MEYILLDTNILIYREGEKKLDKDILTLSRLLMDSIEYKLVIHPLSIEELKKYKDKEQRDVIISKVSIYKLLENPPKIDEKFLEECGGGANSHEYVDNNLLYALKKNYVSYLITNDKGILKKAKRLGLKRVLSITDAIHFLSKDEELILSRMPLIIKEKELCEISINDPFFTDLKKDYANFEKWYEKKQLQHKKAYVAFKENGQLGAFLMLKIEDEREGYDDFDVPLERGKRIKVSTFKVVDNGKAIGEALLKIMFDYALANGIYEIYITIYDKHKRLIDLFKEYGFEFCTYKLTEKQIGTYEKEGVYIRKISNDKVNYPILKVDDQSVFIVPIQNEYCIMLFPDVLISSQISMSDLMGTSTYGNVIKKAYICTRYSSKMKPGDIVVFYASKSIKSIVCIGVVDDAFKANELDSCDAYKKVVKRRTVYEDSYLENAYQKGFFTILFKYYTKLDKYIKLEDAIREGIIKMAPQSLQSLDREKFKKLLELAGTENKIKI